MEKSEIALIRFDGKKYTSWAFQFQIYLEGKELWGYMDGSEPKPKEDDKKISAWDCFNITENNSRVLCNFSRKSEVKRGVCAVILGCSLVDQIRPNPRKEDMVSVAHDSPGLILILMILIQGWVTWTTQEFSCKVSKLTNFQKDADRC
eukprot:TRINITY_DN9553_c0_g1_i1.p1 TRINITY_DN9553_c0_g1~~TRINITY_DN9553_c0_g1_i1.p1  ORF type:complete len:148 (+),score=19.88 TRINITY_DN9553_c0_g1_i1:499-942(+)